MNTLKALRERITTALASSGVKVEDHLPERISPPLVMLAAGSPYLEAGNTYGTFNIRFTVILVGAQGPNEVTTQALDDNVAAVLVALDAHDLAIERVDQPTMLAHSGTHFLSTTIDVVCAGEHIDDGKADQ